MNEAIVRCRELCKSYPVGDGGVQSVLTNVDFSVAAGEAVSIAALPALVKRRCYTYWAVWISPTAVRWRLAGVIGRNLAKRRPPTGATSIWVLFFQFHLLLPEFSALENTAMAFN